MSRNVLQSSARRDIFSLARVASESARQVCLPFMPACRLLLLAGLVVSLIGKHASAQAPADSTQPINAKSAETDPQKSKPLYLRIHKTESGKPIALETAIRRFTAGSGHRYAGAQVDLVGVIHIGERDYYQQLNELLSHYDAVLYELVAPDGTRIKPEDLANRRSVLASMQSGMKDMLELEYQLALIDYQAENFVHADMSPEEFMKDMESRGDDLWKMFARLMGAGLASQTGGELGILSAMMSDNRTLKLRRVFAKQLLDADAVTAGMDDAQGENTLIKGRNRKAFEVLERELAAGKRKIAVFYGAGHLNDMAERLKTDFGLADQPDEAKWLAAWNLAAPESDK